MSREELEKRILEARYNLVSSKDKETIDILEELAIKALEQEPILDKIRAEIEKPLREEIFFDTENAKAQAIALNWCIEIIDKYRKEN